MSMAWCLDCHRDPTPHLRPADQVTNMQWDPAQDPILRAQGRTQQDFARTIQAHGGINPPTSCTACHR
jgi:menaquinone reductase, multiheme cytochrome c subunit